MSGFSNLYPNLPGMLVEYKDGGKVLRIDESTSNTDSMLILGTAMDGPVMEPVAVDMNTAELVFGKDIKSNRVPNGSTLMPAFKQAWESGCRDIRLMRVTGSSAKAEISKKGEDRKEQTKMVENLGLIEGCDESKFELSNKNIASGSVRVSVNGVILRDKISINHDTGEVKLDSNAADAGADVTISYDYHPNVKITREQAEIVEAGGERTIKIKHIPNAGSEIIITTDMGADTDGVVLDKEKYTIEKDVITIEKDHDLGNFPAGDKVRVTYDAVNRDETRNAIENGKDKTLFVTATSPQVIKLKESPVSDTLHLYINDSESLTPGIYEIDELTKEISIKKEAFPMGSHIQVSYLTEEVITVYESIEFESIFGGEIYNKGTLEVLDLIDTKDNDKVVGKKIVITKPDGKKGQVAEEPLVYGSNEYVTFAEVVTAINSDPYNNVYKARTDYPDALLSDLEVDETARKSFFGGDDGVNVSKEVMFKALSGTRDDEGYLETAGAYQLLEDYQVDWVVPVGVYADDELSGRYDSFAYELGLFCAILSHRNKTTLGGISLKPCNDTSLAGIQDYARNAIEFRNMFLMRDATGNIIQDADGIPTDLGKFLSVVVGPEPAIADPELGTRFGDPAVSYIAMNTSLLAQSAPTNKRLRGAKGLKFRFSNKQLNDITGNRLVGFKLKTDRAGGEGTPAIVDGVTAARPDSEYTRLTTSKVVREAVDHIREVADPFIGEPNTVEDRNALSASISKRLGLLKEKGVIVDYAFQIMLTAMDQALGQATIELTLVAPQELRKITTIVGLSTSI